MPFVSSSSAHAIVTSQAWRRGIADPKSATAFGIKCTGSNQSEIGWDLFGVP
jgi:hypothetical protein